MRKPLLCEQLLPDVLPHVLRTLPENDLSRRNWLAHPAEQGCQYFNTIRECAPSVAMAPPALVLPDLVKSHLKRIGSMSSIAGAPNLTGRNSAALQTHCLGMMQQAVLAML